MLITRGLAVLLSALLVTAPGALRAADAVDVAASDGSGTAQLDQLWTSKGLPLIETYCLDCHNADFQEAELDLEQYQSAQAVAADRGHWEKILERIRFESMPPEDASQPSEEERAALVVAIETMIYGTACDLDPKPGRVTVRRLNRAEYNNTIRDLFGVDIRPADDFPSDEVGAGFDNNGDVLSLPPMLFEKYVAAAEQVAAAVIVDADEVERIDSERSGDLLHWIGPRRIGSFYKHYMHEGSVTWAEFKVPLSGDYRLRIAGSSGKEDEVATIAAFDTAGHPLGTVDLEYSDGGDSNSETLRLQLQAGEQRIFLARVPSADEVPEVLQAAVDLDEQTILEARAREGKPLEVDRDFDGDEISFATKSITLAGPRGVPESLLTEGHRQLIQKRPGKERSVAQAARPGVEWLLGRAFRGPVDDVTVDAYVDLVAMAEKREKSFERGMRVAVTAALVSPRFLFRVEVPPVDAEAEDGSVPLTSYQIASRLSYFLWSSTPDPTLLELAAEDRLRDTSVLREQIQRMLKDSKSEALADNFAAQWFGLRNLQSIEPDATRFTSFDDQLREAMRQETRLLFLDVLREDRSVLDLLDADETFLNQRLAEHYGVSGVSGDEFRKVSLEGVPRRGILTHASILTLTSNPTRTSPVKRGKWIMENVLGTPPPEPPPGIPELEETGASNPDASFREQLEIHRSDPACASCHRVMDPLGFGFENFDVVGGFREADGDHPVDASGELPGGLRFDGAVELIEILRKRNAEQFAHTAAERLLTFALGRELRFEDRCVVDGIVRKASEQDYRFSTLVTEVVLSPAFRFQTPEGN